jgi:Zeta toxin
MASTMVMTAPAGPVATFSALASTEGASAYQDALDQGVAGGTAAKLAALHGLFAGAGATAPMVFGSALATRLLTGAASNVTFGTVGRAADSSILRNDGYTEMADQQQVFDRSQMLVDLVMGLGFGGIHHLLTPAGMQEMPKITRAMQNDSTMRDAALYAELAIKDRESGPGVPVTPGDMNAHMAAHDRALDDIEAGRRVNVAGTGVEDSTVLLRGGDPNPEVSDMIHSALKDAGLYEALTDRDAAQAMLDRRLSGEEGIPREGSQAHEIPRATNLDSAGRDIEGRFAEQLGGDYEGEKQRYAGIEDSEGGKVINTDTARELSSDYRADRTQSAAVHEPASWFTKRLFADALKRNPKRGESNMVLFTAGGTGAGKSTALKAMGDLTKKAQIIVDTNMNNFDSALKKVNQALAAGKKVHIAYTFRDPIEALKEGALHRAKGQEAKYGSGRTVPIDEHLATHLGSRDVMDRLAAHFEGDKRVKIIALDNRFGRGNAREVSLPEIPKFDEKAYTPLRERAIQILDEERAGGFSESIYRGFRGETPELPDTGQGAGPELGTRPAGSGAGGESQSQRASGDSDPVNELASQAIIRNPELTVSTDDGATVRASNAMASAAETTRRAEAEAPSMFKAAVECFMGQT